MALYDSDGKIIAAEPVATIEKNQKVTEQDWYKSATDEIEARAMQQHPTVNLVESDTRLVDINGKKTGAPKKFCISNDFLATFFPLTSPDL